MYTIIEFVSAEGVIFAAEGVSSYILLFLNTNFSRF